MELLHTRKGRAAPALALLDGGRLVEYRTSGGAGLPAIGAIYRARVTRVVAGGKGVFLSLDAHNDGYLPGAERDARDPRRRPPGPGPAPGQTSWVQVRRPPVGRKAARVTRRIALPGVWLVATPAAPDRAVSRRITDAAERRRLRSIVESLAPGEMGFVARTAAGGAPEQSLHEEAGRLVDGWRALVAAHDENGPAALLRQAPTLLERGWLDHAGAGLDRVVVDDEADRELLLSAAGSAVPGPRIELHAAESPLFETAGVATAWTAASARTQLLPGGGRLVMEPTEALIAVDVDSGQDEREPAGEAANLEAVAKLAWLARLRDLRGTVVVDFITPRTAEQRKRIAAALERALAGDPARTRVVGISDTGLLELVRGYR